jgi:hypothetical protein
MFCSDLQLEYLAPTRFCDLISLATVAYYVVKNEVPSTIYAREMSKKDPATDYFQPKEFKKLRLIHTRRFE